jgi:hypothetical protein
MAWDSTKSAPSAQPIVLGGFKLGTDYEIVRLADAAMHTPRMPK